MKKRKWDFSGALLSRLDENRKLYEEQLGVSETRGFKFVASSMGVNPWRVIMPVSFGLILLLRLLLGRGFVELVLRVSGGP